MPMKPRVRCRVCGKLPDALAARATAFDALVYGAAPFAVCVACGQEPPNRHDPHYRKRFVAHARKG
jgi:hypothetical protein